MDKNGKSTQAGRLGRITRELEAMSDWELERGCASSHGFDDDQTEVAHRILRKRYAGSETGVGFWILVVAAGAGVIALLE